MEMSFAIGKKEESKVVLLQEQRIGNGSIVQKRIEKGSSGVLSTRKSKWENNKNVFCLACNVLSMSLHIAIICNVHISWISCIHTKPK